ncbi:MAG: ABC transporter ATP-binding protein [Hyphomicrobiaceae bacterium]
MPNFRGAHITIEAVTHRYRGGRANALEDISILIEPGETVALVGRSGCGKSTLLHIIAGLASPTEGTVHIDGLHVQAPSPKWVMMFQQPSLLPWMTVAQNVALGLMFNNRRPEAPKRVTELLQLVQLADYAERNVQDLSGGQQQRVALARSLALEPEALLLDEPFSALDAFTRSSLQRDVRAIVRDRGITMVLVTHDINEAALMADRAFIMSSEPGRIRDCIEIEAGAAKGGDALQRARKALMDAYARAAGSPIENISSEHDAVSGRPMLAELSTSALVISGASQHARIR